MNYTVVWTQDAYQSLLDLASSVLATQQLIDAVDDIHRRLGEDPHKQGESRPGNRRIMFSSPLGVIFRIDIRLQQVVISEAWGYLPRNE